MYGESARFNPVLLNRVRQGLAEKTAFVALGPNGDVAAQQAQQQQAQQPQQPGADPQQAMMAGAGGGGGGQPNMAPQQPQQPMPPPTQQSSDAGQTDQLRAVMREELERNEQKPKKLSIQDRVTQLEGLLLRVMEHNGLIPTDPGLTNQQPSATGVDAPAATPSQPQQPGMKTAAAADAALQVLLAAVRSSFQDGLLEMEKSASEESDAQIVGEVDFNPVPTQYIGDQDVFQNPETHSFAHMISNMVNAGRQ